MELELVAITQNGELSKPAASASPVAAEIVDATTKLYRTVGYEPPWVGYLAIENGICVGTCGFKSPPQNNRVEIAYFTFPGHESRGVATRMASQLIRLALDKMPAVTVAAQTLPEENASTSILKKLRFRLWVASNTRRTGWFGSGSSVILPRHNKRFQSTGISTPLIDNLRVMQLSPDRGSAAFAAFLHRELIDRFRNNVLNFTETEIPTSVFKSGRVIGFVSHLAHHG